MGRGKPNETHSCTQPIFNLVRETERASWYGDQNESRTSRDPGIWRICFRIFFFPLSVFKGKSCWVQPSKLLIKILSFYVGNILGLVLVFFFVCFFNAGLLYEWKDRFAEWVSSEWRLCLCGEKNTCGFNVQWLGTGLHTIQVISPECSPSDPSGS